MNVKTTLAAVVVALCGAGGAYYMTSTKPVPNKRPAPTPVPLVTTTVVSASTETLQVESRGVVAAQTSGTLVPQVAGQIIRIGQRFKTGGYFTKGELLIEIDPRDYENGVTIAESDLAQAKVLLSEEKARSEQARKNWLRLGSDSEPNNLVLRKPQLEQAKAQIDAANARLQQARVQLERTKITAPYNGIIRSKLVDVGQVVTSNQVLAEIYATEVVEIRLPVGDVALQGLDVPSAIGGGDNAALEVELHKNTGAERVSWLGKVLRAEGVIDSQTRQTVLIAEVEQPFNLQIHAQPLAIGSYVNALITGRQLSNVFKLPLSALVDDRWFFEVKDKRLFRHEANIVWRQKDTVLIANDLDNDRNQIEIVTVPPPFANNGMLVKKAAE